MTDGEHAEKFAQLSKNLAMIARALVAQHPEFPPADFGRAFLVAAIGLMTAAAGLEATAAYLRGLADALDRGDYREPVN